MSSSARVAIVGAGPTGLTLANLLGVYGVSCVLIERKGKAMRRWPRSMALPCWCGRIVTSRPVRR